MGSSFAGFGDLFFEFQSPLYCGGCRLLNSNPLLMIFLVCQMSVQEGFKFCLDTRINRAPTLDLACPNPFNPCDWFGSLKYLGNAIYMDVQ
jgi:hypothetical protein